MKRIDIEWMNSDESLLLITFHNGWTGNDYVQMIKEMSPIISSKPHLVNVFVIFHPSYSYPNQLVSIIHSSVKYYSDNVEFIVVITQSLFVQYMYHAIKPLLMLAYTIVFTDSIEEAYRLLELHKGDVDV